MRSAQVSLKPPQEVTLILLEAESSQGEDRITVLIENCPVCFFQIYQISWCQEEEYHYCWPLNTTNSPGNATHFTMQVLSGYTYNFYVQAYTAYGVGRESSIQVIVPPLDLAVPRGYGRATGGNYGLEVSLHWWRPYFYVDNTVSARFVLLFFFAFASFGFGLYLSLWLSFLRLWLPGMPSVVSRTAYYSQVF